MLLYDKKSIQFDAGFSMLELLVVMTIMALISSVVIPDIWGRYEKVREGDAVAGLAADFKKVRLAALHGKKKLTIVFSEKAGVSCDDSPDCFVGLPDGWRLTKGKTPVFFETGVVRGAVMVFLAPSGRKWQLQISHYTGDAHIIVGR